MKHQYRFFLPAESFRENTVFFPVDITRQIRNVLRLRSGDTVVALDGSGVEFTVCLDGGGDRLSGSVVSRAENAAECRRRVHVFQGVLKAKKLETVWQKCAELGVASLTPVMTENAVPEAPSSARTQRFEAITREAAEQSGRGRLPALGPACGFEAALSAASSMKLLFEPGDVSGARLDSGLAGLTDENISLFIGPEGGFTVDEVRTAVASGCRVISLGPRILRSETAAVVAVALTMSQLGELSPRV